MWHDSSCTPRRIKIGAPSRWAGFCTTRRRWCWAPRRKTTTACAAPVLGLPDESIKPDAPPLAAAFCAGRQAADCQWISLCTDCRDIARKNAAGGDGGGAYCGPVFRMVRSVAIPAASVAWNRRMAVSMGWLGWGGMEGVGVGEVGTDFSVGLLPAGLVCVGLCARLAKRARADRQQKSHPRRGFMQIAKERRFTSRPSQSTTTPHQPSRQQPRLRINPQLGRVSVMSRLRIVSCPIRSSGENGASSTFPCSGARMVGQVGALGVQQRVVVAAPQLQRHFAGDGAGHQRCAVSRSMMACGSNQRPLVQQAAQLAAVVAVLFNRVLVVDAGDQALVGNKQQREAGAS